MRTLYVAVVLFLAIGAAAEMSRKSRIGPAVGSPASWGNGTQAVTLGAAGANVRNCLRRITFLSTSTSTLRVLDGGTTVYSIDLGASALDAETWGEDDMCGTANTVMYIQYSTGIRLSPLTLQNVDYIGFTY